MHFVTNLIPVTGEQNLSKSVDLPELLTSLLPRFFARECKYSWRVYLTGTKKKLIWSVTWFQWVTYVGFDESSRHRGYVRQTRNKKNASGGGSAPDTDASNCHPLPRWRSGGITPVFLICAQNHATLCIIARCCSWASNGRINILLTVATNDKWQIRLIKIRMLQSDANRISSHRLFHASIRLEKNRRHDY